jgi:hypothetical protein
MGHGDDINLVLPVKKRNEEGKLLEQNAASSVQLPGVMQGRVCARANPASNSSRNLRAAGTLRSEYQTVA